MNFSGKLSLVLLIILSVLVVDLRDNNNVSLEELQNNLTSLNNLDITILKEIPYKNPYQTNFTTRDFVLNTGHILIYPIIKEFHTVIGIGSSIVYNRLTKEILKKGLIIGASGIVLWFIIIMIKPIAIIGILIKERKENKLKKLKNEEN